MGRGIIIEAIDHLLEILKDEVYLLLELYDLILAVSGTTLGQLVYQLIVVSEIVSHSEVETGNGTPKALNVCHDVDYARH